MVVVKERRIAMPKERRKEEENEKEREEDMIADRIQMEQGTVSDE